MQHIFSFSKKLLENKSNNYKEIKEFCENKNFIIYKFTHNNTNIEIVKNKKNELTITIDYINKLSDILRNLPFNTKKIKINIYENFYDTTNIFDNLSVNINKIIFINKIHKEFNKDNKNYNYLFLIKKLPFNCNVYVVKQNNKKYKVKFINNEIFIKKRKILKKIIFSNLYIPLQFWFNDTPSMVIPLMALQYNDISLKIKF
jgi:hypothetical protein